MYSGYKVHECTELMRTKYNTHTNINNTNDIDPWTDTQLEKPCYVQFVTYDYDIL